jgi:hypothetical protein
MVAPGTIVPGVAPLRRIAANVWRSAPWRRLRRAAKLPPWNSSMALRAAIP